VCAVVAGNADVGRTRILDDDSCACFAVDFLECVTPVEEEEDASCFVPFGEEESAALCGAVDNREASVMYMYIFMYIYTYKYI